jgi:hypothetical protein
MVIFALKRKLSPILDNSFANFLVRKMLPDRGLTASGPIAVLNHRLFRALEQASRASFGKFQASLGCWKIVEYRQWAAMA